MKGSQLVKSRYEIALSSYYDLEGDLFCSQVAGSIRAARCSSYFESDREDVVWTSSTSVAGPLLYFYVDWVLARAHEMGLGRLLFVSRDGYILHKIAKIVSQRKGYQIALEYFHTSRIICLLSWIAIHSKGRIDQVYDLLPKEVQYLKSVLKHLALRNPEDEIRIEDLCRRFLSSHYTISELDSLLSTEEMQQFLESYLDGVSYYLRSVWKSKNERRAIVDIGWTGRSGKLFSQVLDALGMYHKEGVHRFFLGEDPNYCGLAADSLESFFFDRLHPRRYRLYIRAPLELLSASGTERTIGYRVTDGHLDFVFQDAASEVFDWPIGVQHAGILAFADIFSRYWGGVQYTLEDLSSILEILLEHFLLKPTIQESQVYGDFLFDSGLAESELRKIAPHLSYGQLVKGIEHIRYLTMWPSASFKRSKMLSIDRLYSFYQSRRW